MKSSKHGTVENGMLRTMSVEYSTNTSRTCPARPSCP